MTARRRRDSMRKEVEKKGGTMKKQVNRQQAKGPKEDEGCLADVKNPLVLTFARNLGRWRRGKGYTLKDVATELDMSISIVCEWEHGRRFPSAGHLLAVSRIMGVPAWTLLREAR